MSGLDDAEKRKLLTLSGLELRPLGHPSRIQSLYLLCYPDSHLRHLNIDESIIILELNVTGCEVVASILLIRARIYAVYTKNHRPGKT
jgi:hypothetical protein